MKRLTKDEMNRLADAAVTIDALFDEIDALRDKFLEDAQIIVEQMTEARNEAWGIMDDAANVAEEYYDERSEKWQEGEIGERYAEWRDRLREVADAIQEDIEVPEVQDVERPAWVDEIKEQDFSEFEA